MRLSFADSFADSSEGQRLALALLTALALHALLIFGIQFTLLSKPPTEPVLSLNINLLERRGSGNPPELATPVSPPEGTEEAAATPAVADTDTPPPAILKPAEPSVPQAAEPLPPVTAPEPVATVPAPQASRSLRHKTTPAPTLPPPALKSAPSRAEKTKTAPPATPVKPVSNPAEKIGSKPAPPATPVKPVSNPAEKIGSKPTSSQAASTKPAASPTVPSRLSGLDLLNRGLEMARNDTAPELQAGDSREKRSTTPAITTLKSFYEENWARKVERMGTIPEEALKLKLITGPTLDVAIRADGSIHSITVLRSSGHKAVDAAARNMVELAAPYAPFPPELRRQVTLLHIVRKWKFEHGKLLSE
jgi:protein TonB